VFNFLFVLSFKKMHFAHCAALAAVLFIIL